MNGKGHLAKLQVLHYVQNANKNDFTKHKSIYVLSFSFRKRPEYHTCKGREDEVNQGGHLTKHQEAVHVLNRSLSYFNVSM